jgi:hypothetical protein
MRLVLALTLLAASTAAAVAQSGAYCPYGQTCQNSNPVPFPVINPVQGLNNILTLPQRDNQPPSSQPPAWAYAPIATPPPVMPPGMAPPATPAGSP